MACGLRGCSTGGGEGTSRRLGRQGGGSSGHPGVEDDENDDEGR